MGNRRAAVAVALLSALLVTLVGAARWLDARPAWVQYPRLLGTNPEVVEVVLPDGRVERCLTCHRGIEPISPSHPVEAVGCAACHGGDPLSLDLEQAHRNLLGGGNPADLRVASASCGGPGPGGVPCHDGRSDPEENLTERVARHLMATKAGELTEVRRAFGLDASPEAVSALAAWLLASPPPQGQPLEGSPSAVSPFEGSPLEGSPLEQKFGENCLSGCHLYAGSYGDSARNFSGGCAACHYLYDPSGEGGTYQGGDVTIPKEEPGHGRLHQLTTRIPYTQCNACHNQGTHSLARMEFDAWEPAGPVGLAPEAFQPPPSSAWRQQPGGETWAERVSRYYLPGERFALCEVSLDCIDCHTRHEVMGDPAHDARPTVTKAEAVQIQCADCHGTVERLPASRVITDPEDRVLRDPRLLHSGEAGESQFPPLSVGDRIGVTSFGEPLPYLRFTGSGVVLYSKVTGDPFPVPLAYGSACEQDPLKQDSGSCHRCHDVSAMGEMSLQGDGGSPQGEE